MITYRASNDKIVTPSKMDEICDLSHDGQYGAVDSTLYRTRKSHQWYIVSESSWGGEGNISEAEAISTREAAELVAEHNGEEDLANYPELAEHRAAVVDE